LHLDKFILLKKCILNAKKTQKLIKSKEIVFSRLQTSQEAKHQNGNLLKHIDSIIKAIIAPLKSPNPVFKKAYMKPM
jgi:hypothetical protein